VVPVPEKVSLIFMRNLFNFIVALSFVLVASAHAQQSQLTRGAGGKEQRVALVIGNGAYTVGPLKTPVNDARGVTQTLRNLGFEVTHKENLTQNSMKRAIREFGAKLRQGGVGLFYYAGHGVRVGDDNYLIPVDATPTSEEEVEYDAVNAGLVLAQMEAARNGLNIVILDACRNNPFARTFRAASNGLVRVNAPNGTLIAYATAPGSIVSDGDNASNGVYTEELLKFMRVPGLSVEEVFKRVRLAVRQRTRDKQVPWEDSSLTGDFYFAGNKTGDARPATAAAAVPGPRVADADGSVKKQTEPSANLNLEAQLRIYNDAKRLYKGILSSKKEDYSKAIAEYREALRLEPKNAFYHNALGNTLRKKTEWDWAEIIRSQDKSRKKVEKKRMWLVFLGVLAAGAIGGPGAPPPQVPDWELPPTPIPPLYLDDEIISELKAASQLEPSNAKYHNDFGATVFDSRNNPNVAGTEEERQVIARAEMAFRKAVRLEPNNPIFLNNLGNALNAQNKWAEAEAEYRKLVELEPGNVSYHIGLFKALNGQSKWTEAAQVYIEIQRLKPDSYSKSLLSDEIRDKKALKQEIKRLKK
jgi:uncharacterized caspase-like protein